MRRERRIRGGDGVENDGYRSWVLYNWAGGDEWTGSMSRKEGST